MNNIMVTREAIMAIPRYKIVNLEARKAMLKQKLAKTRAEKIAAHKEYMQAIIFDRNPS